MSIDIDKIKEFKLDGLERKAVLIVLMFIVFLLVVNHYKNAATHSDNMYMGGYNAGYRLHDANDYAWYTALTNHHKSIFGDDDNTTIARGYIQGANDYVNLSHG